MEDLNHFNNILGVNMENKNIIIILLIVVVIIAAAIGVMLLSPFDSKEDTKLTITSNKTLHEGDKLKVKLTDINGTKISNETINITITDSKGVNSHYSVVTNSKGVGTLKLDKSPGKYTVNCTYGGNENYTGNSTSKKIKIEEVVEQTQVTEQASSASSSSSGSASSSDSGYGSYINDEWVSMSEQEYAERYPALYHMQTLDEGRYDQYHPEMYEVDRENGMDVDY